MSVRSRIFEVMRQIAQEQEVILPPLEDDLAMYDTGFDSLAFALLVVRLEDDLGVDPFALAEDDGFPSTVGDFVRAYENVPGLRLPRCATTSEPPATEGCSPTPEAS